MEALEDAAKRRRALDQIEGTERMQTQGRTNNEEWRAWAAQKQKCSSVAAFDADSRTNVNLSASSAHPGEVSPADAQHEAGELRRDESNLEESSQQDEGSEANLEKQSEEDQELDGQKAEGLDKEKGWNDVVPKKVAGEPHGGRSCGSCSC